MTKDEALRIALEALVDFGWHIENCPQFPTWAEPKKHPPCTCGYDTTITALCQALEQPEQAPTVPDNMQDWANLDGDIAWHLIERHADNWADIKK